MDKPTTRAAKIGSVDDEASRQRARTTEVGGKALAADTKPREEGKIKVNWPTTSRRGQDRRPGDGILAADPQCALELEDQPRPCPPRSWAGAGQAHGRRAGRPVVASIRRRRRSPTGVVAKPAFDSSSRPTATVHAASGWSRNAAGIDEHPPKSRGLRQANPPTRSRRRLVSPTGTARETLASTRKTSCAVCTCSARTSRPATAISRPPTDPR